MIGSTLRNTNLRTGRSFDLGKMNLRQLWIAYLTYPTILLYIVLAVCSFAVLGRNFPGIQPTAIAVGAVILVYPVTWYLLHRYILHGRFLYRIKLTAGLWKRIHFDHHQDPHLLDVLFGSPLNTIPTIAIITLPIGYLIGHVGGAAAALGTGLVITCIYEFFHCIQHLNYKPRARWIQKMKQLHVLHHFHDEDGNFGITSYVVDRVFGSYYGDTRARPRSPSVFNLGYDTAEAARYPWVMDRTGAPPRDRPDGAVPRRNVT
ncbi:fatty acid hydroxylase [Gluconacetobacter diazotrophicus PA1 5]|uniref:Putative fatty acid hydroxylase n=1 Tax=Gluconacetobacter diazotrophicus (strain ATCC 49037 / DSM 5601 / CCUG 37298 / CIP 103539 / LMG 7603 / PAl5) TaxID=272568 RepID=A9HRC9_GLUDA|nr:sterol desaturase family protein [Gluconacetobacter diazotrophicus]ACI53141.1 fatty acid hydroxylase [Gluconacetobacter diazotrophicus PA1 5]TWB05583.1 sterol desaturase/sphingolipid hydroxylase (fatty acid hydroxylase superfamily) [Gluconacetobacter diazotrophicus]CAP56877.1 putative fatty acid hydroxylase [Gluconacetobacter diazotrophicus PA1 5]